jgi:Tol biopolymer transport system component
MAQKFNEQSLRVEGEAVTIAENVLHDVVLGRAVFSASSTGTLVYQVGSAVAGSKLVWLDRSGNEVGIVAAECPCVWPRLSPDGKRVTVAVTDPGTGNVDIWIHEIAEKRRTHLTFEDALEANPTWTLDGGRIVFTSTRKGPRDIHWMDASGGGLQEALFESPSDKTVQSVTKEGVVFLQDGDLWLLPLSGKRDPRALVKSESQELFGEVSPDRQWLVYQSNAGGRNNIYVTTFPASSGRWLVSEDGGILPRWSAKGDEIFYLSQDHSALSVAAVSGKVNGFRVTSTQRLFTASMVAGRGFPYDVSNDGQRFLVIASSNATKTPLTLVVDWPSELNR